MLLSVEVKNLLRIGVFKECQHEEGEYISQILTPKSGGSFRMILTLKNLEMIACHMPF